MSKTQDTDVTRLLKQVGDEMTHALFGGRRTRRRPAARAATPPYQVMPPLSAQQSDVLKASIQADGIRVPIDVDEAGVILDGHQRLAIATDLGIECPRRTVSGLSATQKRHYALTVNLMRRQLDGATWGTLFKQLLEARGIKRGQGSRNDRQPTSLTMSEVAKEVGVPASTARRRLKKAEQSTTPLPRPAPPHAARVQKKPAHKMVDPQPPMMTAPISAPVSWRVALERALRVALNSAEIDEIIVHVANVLQVDIVAK
jgi:transposase-like protein